MQKTTCSIADCEKPNHAKGLCSTHYMRWLRSPDRPKSPPLPSATERLWAKVTRTETCWNWTGSTTKGYGHIRIEGKLVLVHRYSYKIHFGEISDGLLVDHRCHNERCVNPEHLRLATTKQNQENLLGATVRSRTGVRGVRLERGGTFRMAVKHHGKVYGKSGFGSIEEAEAAVIAKRNELFTHNDLDRREA